MIARYTSGGCTDFLSKFLSFPQGSSVLSPILVSSQNFHQLRDYPFIRTDGLSFCRSPHPPEHAGCS